MITDKDSFLQFTEVTDMDAEFKELLWIRLTEKINKLSEQQTNVFNWKLNQPPSFEEFRETIKKGKGGKTSGLSGLTYQVMKEWPDEVIRLIYTALCKTMKEKY